MKFSSSSFYNQLTTFGLLFHKPTFLKILFSYSPSYLNLKIVLHYGPLLFDGIYKYAKSYNIANIQEVCHYRSSGRRLLATLLESSR
jgi:hypothetical protein